MGIVVVVSEDVLKASVKGHTRRLANGTVVQVAAYTDNRGAKRDAHTADMFARPKLVIPPSPHSDECMRNPEKCTGDLFGDDGATPEQLHAAVQNAKASGVPLHKSAVVVSEDLLKAVVKKSVWIAAHQKKDGTTVQGHQRMVNVSLDHDHAKVASGQGSHYQKVAHKKLQAELADFDGMDEHDKAMLVLAHATDLQDAATLSSAMSVWKAGMLAGKKATPAQLKAFLQYSAQSPEKAAALAAEIAGVIGADKLKEQMGGKPAAPVAEAVKPPAAAPKAPAVDPAATFYHYGSHDDASSFAPLTYFAADKKAAESYKANGPGQLHEVKLDVKNPASSADVKAAAKALGFGPSDVGMANAEDIAGYEFLSPHLMGEKPAHAVMQSLKDQGFDGAKFDTDFDMGGALIPGGSVAIFSASQVKPKDGGPKEGDTKPGADGSTLVLKDGHWVLASPGPDTTGDTAGWHASLAAGKVPTVEQHAAVTADGFGGHLSTAVAAHGEEKVYDLVNQAADKWLAAESKKKDPHNPWYYPAPEALAEYLKDPEAMADSLEGFEAHWNLLNPGKKAEMKAAISAQNKPQGDGGRAQQNVTDALAGKKSHYQNLAAKKLSGDGAWQLATSSEQWAQVKALAVSMQAAASASSAVSGWKKAAHAGKNPSNAQWKAFYALPSDKKSQMLDAAKAAAGDLDHLKAPPMDAAGQVPEAIPGNQTFEPVAASPAAAPAAKAPAAKVPASVAKLQQIDPAQVAGWLDAAKGPKPIQQDLLGFFDLATSVSIKKFHKWHGFIKKVSVEKNKGIYRGAAIASLFGMHDQVLTRDGSWVPVKDTHGKGITSKDVVTDPAAIKAAAIAAKLGQKAPVNKPAPGVFKMLGGSYEKVDGGWKGQKTGNVYGPGHFKFLALQFLNGDPVPFHELPAYTELAKDKAFSYVAEETGSDTTTLQFLNTVFPADDVTGPFQGDTKEVNGVTYVLQGGRWHKQGSSLADAEVVFHQILGNGHEAVVKKTPDGYYQSYVDGKVTGDGWSTLESAANSALDEAATHAPIKQQDSAPPGAPAGHDAPVWSSTMHNTQPGHNKFYTIEVNGTTMVKTWGPNGKKGQSATINYMSHEAAVAEAIQILESKGAKGYKFADGKQGYQNSAQAKAPAPAPSVVVTKPAKKQTKAEKAAAAKAAVAKVAVPNFTAIDPHKYSATFYQPMAEAIKAAALSGGLPAVKKLVTFYGDGKVASKKDAVPGSFKTGKCSEMSPGRRGSFWTFCKEIEAALKGEDLVFTDGPKEGDTKQGVSGMLVFKNGHWVLAAGNMPKAEQASAKPAAPLHVPKSVHGKNVTNMSGWEQTGPQKGSNPGGTFKDKTGQQWYCKFPADPDMVRSEFLAAKLYQMLGVSVPTLKLVDQGGKLGIASKWVDGLKKGTAEQLASAKGAHDAFAIDAWIGNWDVVGLSNDNLMLGKDGAVRVDVGGSLNYRAMGGKKGADFGDSVVELETLKDHGKNAKSAAVFAGVTDSATAWGVAQLNKLKPSQIEELCQIAGPGSEADKAALAKKLIARRADILKKMGVVDQWDKPPVDETKLQVNKSDLQTKPMAAIDFQNWNGQGKGLSSSEVVNAQNTKDSQALADFAAKGNLTVLKTYRYDAVDKTTGEKVGKKSITDHPSQHVKEQWAALVELLQSIAHPPADTLQMPSLGGAGSVEDIAEMAGFFSPTDRVETVAAEHRLGFFMKLSQVDDVADVVADSKWSFIKAGSSWVSGQKAAFKKLSSPTRAYVSAVQASGWVNHVFSQGKKTVSVSGNNGSYSGGVQGLAAKIYADAVDIPEGTVLKRGMSDTTAGKGMTKQLLASKPGLVIQNTDSMCTSYNEGHSWGGDVQMTIRCAKGCKAIPSFASGNFGSEHEITTLPGQRFVVLGVEKSGHGVKLDVLMLPPDEGYVAELGKLEALGKALIIVKDSPWLQKSLKSRRSRIHSPHRLEPAILAVRM